MKAIEEMSVKDAMTRGVICVDIEDTVQQAAEVMKKNDISGVIVTHEGEGVGIVTERDIICKLVVENLGASTTTAKKVMSSPLITIPPEASIDEAAALMRDKDIRRLVVSQEDQIIGIISEFDIVKIEPAMHLLLKQQYEWDISKTQAMAEGQVKYYEEEFCGDYCDYENDDDVSAMEDD